MSTSTTAHAPPVRLSDYLWVSLTLGVFSVGLAYATQSATGPAPAADSIIAPMAALVALTGVVWLLMALVRNITILRGITSANYFHDYKTDPPLEWVERPARTFANLLQAPILFYVVCLAMLATQRIDLAQLRLAWIYVAVRTLHAVIYIGWNYVPYRFAAWIASCITLAVLWFRFV
jgi:hypothetical protein